MISFADINTIFFTMRQVLLATHNPAKLRRYKEVMRNIRHIELISLNSVNIACTVPEPHGNARDNAIYKAKEFGRISGILTIGIDEAVTRGQTDLILNFRHVKGKNQKIVFSMDL